MISVLTHIFERRYAHHHALLIVFLSSAIWGVLWVQMRYAESFDYDKADLLGLLAGMAWALGSLVIRRFPNADFMHITFMQYSVGGLLAGTAAVVMGDVFPERHRLIAVLPVALLASTVVFLP